jgi:hypothetical protein
MDNNEKNNQRKDFTKRDSNVDIEVQKLFKRSDGKISQQDFQNLKNKLNDDEFYEKVQRAFVEKYIEITKKAKKFAQLIREKYANTQYPFHILIEKAYKYKVKHGLNDEEFNEFQRIYENELIGLKSPEVFGYNTNLQKVLGNVSVDYQGFTSKLSDNDYKILQDILKLYSSSRALHSQVLLQSIRYEAFSIEAMTGKYNKDIHTVSNHVHPVVAALFLPKIGILEEHFIHSNIAGIIKSRYNKEQFTSIADMHLYDALIKDPNDVICDSRSTMMDLYNRAQLQTQLWNSILSFRNGQYYNISFREFINSIDICRMNKYDSPDLIYGRYDGTILKRLLSAFSFRPTIIVSTPAYNIFNTNPYQQNIKPIVTHVPMINLKLPYSIDETTPIHLNESLDQTQLIFESGVVIPKNTSLIYSRGVLFFYIDRRSNVIYNHKTIFTFNNLPTSIAGFERLNKRNVNFEFNIKIRNDVYELRSVIISDVNNIVETKNLVIGSSTLFYKPNDFTESINNQYYIYDPYYVINSTNSTNLTNVNSTPISVIDPSGTDNTEEGFQEIARSRGIIFMYELIKDSTNGVITNS